MRGFEISKFCQIYHFGEAYFELKFFRVIDLNILGSQYSLSNILKPKNINFSFSEYRAQWRSALHFGFLTICLTLSFYFSSSLSSMDRSSGRNNVGIVTAESVSPTVRMTRASFIHFGLPDRQSGHRSISRT